MTNTATKTTTSFASTPSKAAQLRKLAVRSLTALGIAAAATAMTSTTAAAAVIEKFSTGNWTGGAYSDASGRFSHCAAHVRYRSGTMLLFSVTRKGEWSMGLANGTWQLNTGTTYPVAYRIDRGPILNGDAIAKNEKLVQVFLPRNSKVFRHFRTGQVLRVKAAKEVLTFNLTDTSRMLTSLIGCTRHHLNAARRNSDPFSSASSSSDLFQNVANN